MRSRKELIYLNIKDLTPNEIEALGDMELNCCDNCGEIEQSEKLHWIDGVDDEFLEDEHCVSLAASGMTAICDNCYGKKDEIAQCCSCEKYFIAYNENETDCPHCCSGNWVYGCIDDADRFGFSGDNE